MLSWRRTAVRRRVLVNLKTEKAFRGVLWAKRGPLLVIKHAELLEGRREPVAIDGEVVVERSNVDFVQVLSPPPDPQGQ
jgi:small nuclear ribonucleoprotein (snRNP)-like protein